MDFSFEEAIDLLIALVVSTLFLGSISFYVYHQVFSLMFERIL